MKNNNVKIYDNIIWDFNGTLFNDGELNWKLTNKSLDHLNKPKITFEEYSKKICFPISEFYSKINLPSSGLEYDKIIQLWIKEYQEQFVHQDLHVGIKEFVHSLKVKGKKQFILSALHQNLLDLITEHHNLRDFFHDILGTRSYDGPGKIAEGLQMMAQQNLSKLKTVLIGDTLHDAQVAAAMGIDCILISHGHQHKEVLLREYDFVVDSVEELESFILR